MRVGTVSEGKEWLHAKGVSGPSVSALDSAFPYQLSVTIPRDSGHKTALARELTAGCFAVADDVLLWICGHGVWPSSENPALFYGYRASVGETRNLPDAPCHVIDRESKVVFECLLCLVLYFVWDALIVTTRDDVAIYVSHDEALTVFVAEESAARFEEFERVLNRLGLTIVRDSADD